MAVWIIGRKATIQANGHEYMVEPFLVFEEEADADAACDLVASISGERPIKTSAGIWKAGETARSASAHRNRTTEAGR